MPFLYLRSTKMGEPDKRDDREVNITPSETKEAEDSESDRGGNAAQRGAGGPGRTPGKAEGVEDPEKQGNR
jgi:hypothetical protein